MIYINTNKEMQRQHYDIDDSDLDLVSEFADGVYEVLRSAGIDIYDRVQEDDNYQNWNGGIHSQQPRKGYWLIAVDTDDEASKELLHAAHEAGDARVAKFMADVAIAELEEKKYKGYLVKFFKKSETDLDDNEYHYMNCEFDSKINGYVIGNCGVRFGDEDVIVSWIGSGGSEDDLCEILENSESVKSYEAVEILNSEDAPEGFEDGEWDTCGGKTWAYWREV